MEGSTPTTPRTDTDPERVVRAAWVAFVEGGVAGMLDHCTPGVRWRSLLANGRTVEGHDGIRGLFAGLADAGVSYVSVPYRYGLVGERVVVSVDVRTAHGGVPDDEILQAFIVYGLADGRIDELCEYLTPDEALAAAAAAAA